MKKGQATPLIIGLIVLVVLLAGFIAYQSLSKSLLTGNVVDESDSTDIPENNCEYVRTPYSEQVCETKEFQHTFEFISWDGKEAGKPTINPTIEITNLENRAGVFRVDFALYDDKYFPNDYRKEGYRADVDWSEANIYTHAEEFSLIPYERKEVTITVERKNLDSKYWAKPRVTPPKYEECKTVTNY